MWLYNHFCLRLPAVEMGSFPNGILRSPVPQGIQVAFRRSTGGGAGRHPEARIQSGLHCGHERGCLPASKGPDAPPAVITSDSKRSFSMCRRRVRASWLAALLLSFRQTDPVPAEVNLEMTIGRSQVCPVAFPLPNGMEFVYLIFGKRGMSCTKDEEGASDSRPAGSREVVRTIVVGSIVG